MPFFTLKRGRIIAATVLLALDFAGGSRVASAQAVTTNLPPEVPDPTALETPGATARDGLTNVSAPVAPLPAVNPVPLPAPIVTPAATPAPVASASSTALTASPAASGETAMLAALLTATALGGFLLYQCGLTRAKNCAHTSTLLLLGTLFALAGYWVGGFAVQTGGIGDARAALSQPAASGLRSALDHELGLMTGGHHWGFMGSAGFFLATDETTRDGMAALFLAQSAGLVIAIAAALGAALERGRLLAFSILSFLAGAVIYPLVANWIWGGGWLAGLGREFGLGHGVIDLAGAGVVHETAGTLALAIALVLGPRYGRFEHGRKAGIPGHNVPFIILGAIVLFITWSIGNASAFAGLSDSGHGPAQEPAFAAAAVNVLLGGIGGALVAVVLGAWRRERTTPVRLTRNLLGGAVALSGGSAFFDAWAALVVGLVAGAVVEGASAWMVRRRIDDPTGATAVHGAAGIWGLLAVGLFSNGASGRDLNGVADPVRGLFFGGAGHQLLAQFIGAAVVFAAVFVLGVAVLLLLQKILGNRVRLADEIGGLDWPQVGALGYQPDVEPDDPTSAR